MTDTYLNFKYIGSVENPEDFIKKVRVGKRSGKVPSSLNIQYDKDINEININICKGRALHPVIVVENGKSKLTEDILKQLKANKLTWRDLVDQGIIEYLDATEEEDALIALSEDDITEEYTHLEISPAVILGIVTALVPYANYGQASRLHTGSKTQRQALGLYASNYLLRMDTDVSILEYPQVPIVNTFMDEVVNYKKHPAGQNVTIAVMSYEGYNMDDAIILNKSSIERGLSRSIYFRPYVAEELRYSGGLVDDIGIPDKEVKGYRSETDYKHLEDDGVVYPEAELGEEDVIIGKTSPPRFLGELEEFSIAANIRRESSAFIRQGCDC
jgi:DNA-directed RNA polymerase subunit B'